MAEKRSLEQIVNTIEGTANTLRDSVTPLGKLTLESIDQAVNEAIRDLQGLARDLKYPVAIAEVELELGDEDHPRTDCEVTRLNLSPDEHCHGCTDEHMLQSYVPKELSYMDATEASAEDDP